MSAFLLFSSILLPIFFLMPSFLSQLTRLFHGVWMVLIDEVAEIGAAAIRLGRGSVDEAKRNTSLVSSSQLLSLLLHHMSPSNLLARHRSGRHSFLLLFILFFRHFGTRATRINSRRNPFEETFLGPHNEESFLGP